jgi:hypothetical protein
MYRAVAREPGPLRQPGGRPRGSYGETAQRQDLPIGWLTLNILDSSVEHRVGSRLEDHPVHVDDLEVQEVVAWRQLVAPVAPDD